MKSTIFEYQIRVFKRIQFTVDYLLHCQVNESEPLFILNWWTMCIAIYIQLCIRSRQITICSVGIFHALAAAQMGVQKFNNMLINRLCGNNHLSRCLPTNLCTVSSGIFLSFPPLTLALFPIRMEKFSKF